MRPHLEIEHFSGIERIELDVYPVTILIGPQSVGKSITAKVLYGFNTLPWEIFDAAFDEESGSLNERLSHFFARLLPQASGSNSRGRARYQIGNEYLEFTCAGAELESWKVRLPESLHDIFRWLKDATRKSRTSLPSSDSPGATGFAVKRSLEREFIGSFERIFGKDSCFRSRFIPAGRSFYSQIEHDPAGFFRNAALDPFVSEFGTFWAGIKGRQFPFPEHKSRFRKEADGLLENLLSGRFIRQGSRDVIHTRDGRKLPSKLWSSGQQEVLPLAQMLFLYSGASFSPRPGRVMFVEEPEAHLFPASQHAIFSLISVAHRACQERLRFFVTTHSPYVLSTANVLLKAGQLYSKRLPKEKKAALEAITPEARSLPPGSVGAFYMEQNKCEYIIDEETGLINGSAIDNISGNLSEEFDALLDFEV